MGTNPEDHLYEFYNTEWYEEDMTNQNQPSDIPLHGNVDFKGVLSSDDLAGDPLGNCLLNKGFEGALAPFDQTDHGVASVANEEVNHELSVVKPEVIDLVPSPQIEHQHRTASLAHQQQQQPQQYFSEFSFAPDFTNTSPTSPSAQPHRPFTTRRPSQLRNEYCPESDLAVQSSTMAGHNHPQHITSSPSRYISNAQRDPMLSQGSRPYQEYNVRSWTQPPRVYYHMGYNPTRQMAQHDLQSLYPDPRNHGHISYGQATQTLPQIGARATQQMTTIESSTQPSAQPSTPPNASTPNKRHGPGNPNVSDPSPTSASIKREGSIAGSPLVKKESRKTVRRKVKDPAGDLEEETSSFPKSDSEYIEELVEAMTDGTAAEDNPGMQATWNKIRDNKADKVKAKCREMLGLIKLAQQTQLGEKRPMNAYPDFEHRFQQTCEALRTQKTVCKHLMEAPYSHTVANDPTYAAQRVRNNRRVNGQKSQAITMGRQALGLQGQGKGKGIKRLAEIYDLEDGDESEDDPFADDDQSNSPAATPEIKKQSSSRKQSKKSRRCRSDDDYEQSPTPRKFKRESRSSGKGRTSKKSRSSIQIHDGHLPAMNSSPSQCLQPIEVQGEGQQVDYHPMEPVYGPTAPSLPIALPEFYGNYNQHGHQFNRFANQSTGYSSGTDAEHSDQLHHGKNTNEFDFGFGQKSFGHANSST